MREFLLKLPDPPVRRPGKAPHPPARLLIRGKRDQYVPRILQCSGLQRYEPATLACCLALSETSPEGWFFDIGANVGVYSWLMASLTTMRVVAFEPEEGLLDTAKRVSRDNGLIIDAEAIALGRKGGEAKLFLSLYSDTSHSLRKGFRPASSSVTVRVETLDEYCRKTGHRPSLVKLDVETAEPDVLRGGEAVLRASQPWIICEVLAGRTETALLPVLERLDYHYYRITDSIPLTREQTVTGDRRHRHKNWLFAPRPIEASFWRAMEEWRQALSQCGPLKNDGTPLKGATSAEIAVPPLVDEGRSDSPSCWMMTPANHPPQVKRVWEDQWLISSEMTSAEHVYLTMGKSSFSCPPPATQMCPIPSASPLQIEVSLLRVTGTIDLQFWAIEYSRTSRLTHVNMPLEVGENKLTWFSDQNSAGLRLAFRLAGEGQAIVAQPYLSLLE